MLSILRWRHTDGKGSNWAKNVRDGGSVLVSNFWELAQRSHHGRPTLPFLNQNSRSNPIPNVRSYAIPSHAGLNSPTILVRCNGSTSSPRTNLWDTTLRMQQQKSHYRQHYSFHAPSPLRPRSNSQKVMLDKRAPFPLIALDSHT